jgi:DNA polymerase (family X)
LYAGLQEAGPLPRWLEDLIERLRTPGRDELDTALRSLPSMTRALARAALDRPALAIALDGHDLLLPADLDRLKTRPNGLPNEMEELDALLGEDGSRPVPLGRGWMQSGQAMAELTQLSRLPVTWHRAGGLRRIEPLSEDVVLLAMTDQPEAWVRDVLAQLPEPAVAFAGTRALALLAEPEPIVVRAVRPAEFPTTLLWYTGPRAHVSALHAHAHAQQFRLRPEGLTRADQPVPVESEDDVYRALGLAPVPVELRHRAGAVDDAAMGRLPALVNVSDIRGDLHAHSVWSDGRDSITTMVHAARALGYEYLAITDHSPSARASRVLTLERLERQRAEIAEVREAVPGITLLHGIEVDIQSNGTLDVPDEVLETLDIVLASLHESHGHAPERLLHRYLEACRHPLINVITHPANRSPGRTAGHLIDFDRLFEVAALTGTALEIDGAPGHLDLDAPLAERAAAAGAPIVVDSDCHMSERLGRQMIFGVGLARRAGLGPHQILNTGSVEQVRAFVAAKRRRTSRDVH